MKDLPVERSVWHGYCGSSATPAWWVGAHNVRCAHTDGDIPSQRFRLVVTAQQGAIRFGGYYEIEVKGAVAFDGPTLGVGVRPILSEKLVK